MDLFWLVLIWAVIAFVGVLRRSRRPLAGEPGQPRRREVRESEGDAAAPRSEAPRQAGPSRGDREVAAPPCPKERPRPAVALALNRHGLLRGVVMKEVLSRPRGLRPWRPEDYRHN